jgi:hypothetical protein
VTFTYIAVFLEHKILTMKKLVILPLLLSLFIVSSCDVLQQAAGTILNEPSIEEIGNGLKEALSNGIAKGANALSFRDAYYKGFYKILLPSEVRTVTDKLKNIPGFSNIEEELLEKMNHGAEDAAKEAAPIFVTAIKALTIQDASSILMGSDNAATTYLNKTTNQQLYDKFKPKIISSLDKIGANTLWTKAITAYNKIPLVNKVNTDLSDYVTTEALKGLFKKVAEEEKNIRRNKMARTSELLKKVFAKQDASRS